jgi:hypothetical protein
MLTIHSFYIQTKIPTNSCMCKIRVEALKGKGVRRGYIME